MSSWNHLSEFDPKTSVSSPMFQLRKHCLSKYLTSTLLQVFCQILTIDDIRRLVFDVWALFWCGDEHHISNLAFNAMDYILENRKYWVWTCSICESKHYVLGEYTVVKNFGKHFPQLDVRDCKEYKKYLFKCYEKIRKYAQGRLIHDMTLYRSFCSRKEYMPQDNHFERFLIQFFQKKTFYKRIKEHEEHLNERLFKRRKLQ